MKTKLINTKNNTCAGCNYFLNGFKWSPKRGAWTRGSKTMYYTILNGIMDSVKEVI